MNMISVTVGNNVKREKTIVNDQTCFLPVR